MKLILILFVLLMAAQSYAGLFDHEQERQQYHQEIQAERRSTGGWQIIAGLAVIGSVILFTVGTALGSKARKDGKR